MSHYGWNWVGVVYGDDEYGKGAFQSFVGNTQANNVCLAYQEVLPNYLDHLKTGQYINQVAEKIRSSSAHVVLLILKAELVELLFLEMIRTNTSRTWIASDAWSRSWYMDTWCKWMALTWLGTSWASPLLQVIVNLFIITSIILQQPQEDTITSLKNTRTWDSTVPQNVPQTHLHLIVLHMTSWTLNLTTHAVSVIAKLKMMTIL